MSWEKAFSHPARLASDGEEADGDFVSADHPDLRAFANFRHKNPSDDLHPKVFADWLEEHDDPRAEIARRAGFAQELSSHFNPDGKPVYVLSHEDYIPLRSGDKSILPKEKIRVHVYGLLPGRKKAAGTRRTERQRQSQAKPSFVRLAFGVRADNGHEAEYGGLFSREEAVSLLRRFPRQASVSAMRAISRGYEANTPAASNRQELED